jgi:hypothetical protein
MRRESHQGPVSSRMATNLSGMGKPIITAEEMDEMSPQERADAIDSATVTSWDEVPEPFRSEVLATAAFFGQHARNRRS